MPVFQLAPVNIPLVHAKNSLDMNRFWMIMISIVCGHFKPAAQMPVPDSNFHLYLLIGQSNMAGRGVMDEKSKIINPGIWMLDSLQQWVPATDPVHFDKPAIAGVGPAISFAEAMLAADTSIQIGLIPAAWGGSPIRVWEPGTTYLNAHPYDDAIRRANIARQKGVLKGMLWHQGESDNDSARSIIYLDKLTELIKRLRRDLKEETLPFIAGELGYFNKSDLINPRLGRLPAVVPFTFVVSAKGLNDKGDQLHFSTAAARELGKRYAAAMLFLQKISGTR